MVLSAYRLEAKPQPSSSLFWADDLLSAQDDLSAAKQQHRNKCSRSVNVTRKDTKNCIFGIISIAKKNMHQKDWKAIGKTP